MADFAPNYTARYKLIYSVANLQHSLGLRWPASMAQSAVQTASENLLNSIFSLVSSRLMTSFTLIDAEYSAANSSFFVPVGLGSLAISPSVSVGISKMDEIVTTTWAGRSLGGHKARFVMFGIFWGVTDEDFDDFVVTPTEMPFIGTVAGALNGSGIVANDNLAAEFWRPRATIKVNDAWVENRRP